MCLQSGPGMLAAEPGGWQGTAVPVGPGSPGEAEGRELGRKERRMQVAPAGGLAQAVVSPRGRGAEGHIPPAWLADRAALDRDIAPLLLRPVLSSCNQGKG